MSLKILVLLHIFKTKHLTFCEDYGLKLKGLICGPDFVLITVQTSPSHFPCPPPVAQLLLKLLNLPGSNHIYFYCHNLSSTYFYFELSSETAFQSSSHNENSVPSYSVIARQTLVLPCRICVVYVTMLLWD